jgi:hypothetical protein
MLTFPDGTQAGVMGLNEILAAIWNEGGQPGPETADEIVKRLSVLNYIPPSARSEYREVLMKEYERYAASRAAATAGDACPAPGCDPAPDRGVLTRLRKKVGIDRR